MFRMFLGSFTLVAVMAAFLGVSEAAPATLGSDSGGEEASALQLVKGSGHSRGGSGRATVHKSAGASKHRVKGYWKKDGTYVGPHYRR
ncbi:MAG: hypothetical protein ABT940_02685 [Alphaproteobacteria bacterium]